VRIAVESSRVRKMVKASYEIEVVLHPKI